MPPLLSRLRWAAALAAALCAALLWLIWKAERDPRTPFLPSRAPAAWILYPTPPSALPQVAVELDTLFRRSLVLDRQPAQAMLRVAWSRRGVVTVNGTQAAASRPGGNWKTPVAVDVSRLLHPGENLIAVRSTNDFGPPAAWLSLTGDGVSLVTDESWESSLAGAVWRPARRAARPMDEWGSQPGAEAANPRPLNAARAVLPLLVVFAVFCLLPLWALRAWQKRRPAGPLTRRETAVLFLIVAAFWSALFWNDRRLSSNWGFDSPAHLEYVRTVLERHHLPLADDGWEMYQPPLYYLLAAGLLRLTGHPTVDPGAVVWLRGLGWAAGLLQCASLLAGLRLVFADRLRPLLAGLCLAAFLPVQLYMFQFVTNEGLHAALSTCALWLALRILHRGDTSVRQHLLLGAVLGLALLAKFSALVVCALVVAVLAGRLWMQRAREPRAYARTIGALVFAALLVCGWHYARVTWRFGQPLVGNWNRVTGFAWWMDPGYSTAGTFFRFGRSLTAPLFSAFHGLPDAIYSTFWGEGLLGGAAMVTLRPPWNYGLMAAGYLLALLPMLALLTGLAAATVRLVRDPRSEDLLLLGVLGATAFAVLSLCLQLPFYAQAKAFYGLSALLPLSVLAGLGFEILTRRSWLAAALLSLLLGVWALNAYATFWIPGGVSGEPSLEDAHRALDPEGLLSRSEAAERQGNLGDAVAFARRATEIAPDHPFAWVVLGSALIHSGDTRQAIAALQEALRVAPQNPGVHAELARLYATEGDPIRASDHQRIAERLSAARPVP
jgi:tetratricopeptide (TPR) repeat protein